MVRHKGTRRGAAVNRLEHGRLYLQVSALIEEPPESRHQACPLDKNLAHLGIDGKIHITLPVPKFLICNLVVHLPVLLFDDGKWTLALGQKCQFVHMDSQLTQARPKHMPANAYDVANVEQPLEDLIVEALGKVVSSDVDLNTSARVVKIKERSAAHDAPCHHTPGE